MKRYESVDYFENEKYRIKKKPNFKIRNRFYIKEFENTLHIERYDFKSGWTNNFKLNVFNKVHNKMMIIEVNNSNDYIKKIPLEILNSKNHYENNFYKLYNISDYNDLFKIEYDELSKLLKINRIDSNEGWDQNLIIEYYEKYTDRIKHFYFGPSKEVEKSLFVDFKELEYASIPNYWENNNYIFRIKPNIEYDKFKIDFFDKSSTVYIKRIDVNDGWGLPLMLKIFNKNNKEKLLIYIGVSKENEIYRKIKINKPKIYVGITTIPSRANSKLFLNNLIDFINNQTEYFEKIYITIPKKYHRFDDTISENTVENLENLSKIEIINSEIDYGPGCKYLGPLLYKYNILENNLLVIIDDDRLYNKNLIKNLLVAYNSYPESNFYTGLWSYFFNKNYKYLDENFLEMTIIQEKRNFDIKYGSGVGGFFGFAIFINDLKDFINYNLKILNIVKTSIYHDEGIILSYLKTLKKNIVFIKHLGCKEYKEESPDALCLSNLCNRNKLEKELLYVTQIQNLL